MFLGEKHDVSIGLEIYNFFTTLYQRYSKDIGKAGSR